MYLWCLPDVPTLRNVDFSDMYAILDQQAAATANDKQHAFHELAPTTQWPML